MFKVARALAPSVVLVEDAEQVFVSDKTRAKELTPPGGEPPNRIRKLLAAEVEELAPGDGVLLLCTSRQPQVCGILPNPGRPPNPSPPGPPSQSYHPPRGDCRPVS